MGGKNGNLGNHMEWFEEAEKTFLKILAERVRRDPNGAPILKAIDWTEINDLLLARTGLQYGMDRLRGKYNRMRSVHTKFAELVTGNTGVTWDANSSQVFAPVTVWANYFKRDKIFKTFKKHGCKFYSLLGIVFSTSIASGTFHNPSTIRSQTLEEERMIEVYYK
ncbi:Myb/SANT-like domain [Dillenia turbinata]|uniref:Myb/SANT-like domain n=1 Tax=Dillenia turbinata TaxID=194707 RepID=A0AAN8YVD6_9MAGN